MNLKNRCREFVDKANRKAIMRVGNPVDDLHDFVLSETGRKAEPSLEKTKAVVLYFENDADIDEFIAAIQAVKPSLIARKA